MFNECLIHLCDCTCLNVLHILNYMLIKHKNIFKCFYLFLESVFVLKNIKNFKNNATLFWRLCLVGQASCETLVAAYTKALGEFLVSHGSNSEKHLENFQNSRFLAFSRLYFGDRFTSGSSSCKFTQTVSQLPLRLTQEWTFQLWKILRQIFQNLSHGFLATWTGD